MKHEIQELKVGDIALNKDNARKNIEADPDFPDFVKSIVNGGVRIPVGVVKDGKKFKLCFGERRFRGAKKAGVPTIPAIIFKDISEAEAYDLMYIENKFRKDLKPLEEAAEVAKWLEKMGGDAKKVAGRIGKDRQWVYVRAKIAKGLIKSWRNYIESEEGKRIATNWSLSHFSLIARLPVHIQEGILEEVTDDPWEYETLSAPALDEMVAKRLHLLSKAKWNLEDETLVPKAGACSKCPKRCGHQPMLWFDSDDQVEAGDQCLDEFCWNEKELAWLERTAADLRQKHPGLVLAISESSHGINQQAISEKIGTPLSNWQYTTCSKSTKGAKPVMYVNGKGAGKLTYIKIKEFTSSSAGKPKGVPTPLKKRREQLDAKRWSQVLLDLREKVKEAKVVDITYPDKVTAVMTLVASYGNKSLWLSRYESYGEMPKISQENIKKIAKSKTPLNKSKALELLWESFLTTLDHLLTYYGPITQTPKKFQDDAKWIAEMIGVDIKLLFEDVAQRKGFTVPKSWSKLNADGTPKKAKPTKAKNTKAKNSKKKSAGKKSKLKKVVEGADAKEIKRTCRICKCTDDNACFDEKTGETCTWVEDDLCSACHENLIAAKKTA